MGLNTEPRKAAARASDSDCVQALQPLQLEVAWLRMVDHGVLAHSTILVQHCSHQFAAGC